MDEYQHWKRKKEPEREEQVPPRQCPECRTHMVRHTTVIPKDNSSFKIVGYHWFCPNHRCKHEEDEF